MSLVLFAVRLLCCARQRTGQSCCCSRYTS